jgi:alpha-tubulin suppressor-like RCC1 family protein
MCRGDQRDGEVLGIQQRWEAWQRHYTDSASPVDVIGVSNATGISVQHGRACVVVADGTAKCWGRDYLGDGEVGGSNTPVEVTGVSDARSIATGVVHTCAIGAGGTVKCWGTNYIGQLGDNTFNDSLTPVGQPSLRT